MSEITGDNINLQQIVERFAAGDAAALNQMLEMTSVRMEYLTRTMLNDFSRLRRWEDTGDVMQNASVRLFRAFQTTRPATVRGFFALATIQIRRELIDLIRHYFGSEGLGANHESRSDWNVAAHSLASPVDMGSDTLDPRRLSAWTDLHDQAGQLPDEEREVFDLVYYQGLRQSDAATVLGISERTVRRRWQSARDILNEALDGRMPL